MFGKEGKTMGTAVFGGKFLGPRKGSDPGYPNRSSEVTWNPGGKWRMSLNSDQAYQGWGCVWRLARYWDKDCDCLSLCKGFGIFSFPDWAILGKTISSWLSSTYLWQEFGYRKVYLLDVGWREWWSSSWLTKRLVWVSSGYGHQLLECSPLIFVPLIIY